MTDRFRAARAALVAQIRSEAGTLARDVRAAISWPGVLEAMAEVPRERFVSQDEVEAAYLNAPLAIGHGQTISQPFIVALMTGALHPRVGDRVLEIGTGSGYQAAVLSRLVSRVYSVEIVPELAARARAVLGALGIDNVSVRVSDGHAGWPEEAPFDGIIVTAASDEVPQTLVDQLKPGGRMVLPVGRWRQMLVVVRRDADGRVSEEEVLPVRFVPFVHGGAAGDEGRDENGDGEGGEDVGA